MVIENTQSRVKIKSNLPILRLNHELRGIMVNKGRIHRALGKCFMISSNLIKSDDKMAIEIRQFKFYQRGLEDESTESKIT